MRTQTWGREKHQKFCPIIDDTILVITPHRGGGDEIIEGFSQRTHQCILECIIKIHIDIFHQKLFEVKPVRLSHHRLGRQPYIKIPSDNFLSLTLTHIIHNSAHIYIKRNGFSWNNIGKYVIKMLHIYFGELEKFCFIDERMLKCERMCARCKLNKNSVH